MNACQQAGSQAHHLMSLNSMPDCSFLRYWYTGLAAQGTQASELAGRRGEGGVFLFRTCAAVHVYFAEHVELGAALPRKLQDFVVVAGLLAAKLVAWEAEDLKALQLEAVSCCGPAG